MFLSIALALPFGAQAATIDPFNSFAWGENIGWVDFADTEVTETELTGYSYSSNTGWISLNCSTTNTCADADYGVVNNGLGDLSGYAWGENIGWVDFGGVSINTEGDFLGYAYSPNIGYVSFNCLNTNTCDDVNFKVSVEIDDTTSTSTSTPVVEEPTRSSRGGSSGGRRSTVSTNQAPTGQLSAAEIITGPQENQPTGSYLDENRISSSTLDLEFGMTHPNVKKLQQLLNSLGYVLAESGPGSMGNETEYFGTLTRAALIQYQKDNGIVPSAGYFGPITRAFLALKGF